MEAEADDSEEERPPWIVTLLVALLSELPPLSELLPSSPDEELEEPLDTIVR